MITGTNESKTLTKHILCKCTCRFDGKNVTQINGGITIYHGECKKRHICEKDYIWNPATSSCEKVLWMIQQLRVMKL